MTVADAPVLLEATGLVKRFPPASPTEPPLEAVAGVDVQVRAGEVLGLVGESGSGKTTLGKMLLYILAPDEGQVLFQGIDLAGLTPAELRSRRSQMQMIYQASSAALNPGLTVWQHLEETVQLHRASSGAEAVELLNETLATFHLEGKEDARPRELSGGERRRLVLARCLLPKPALVVADEPTAGLDSSLKSELLDTMLAARRERMSYVFISHELDVVRYVADRVLVLVEGRVVEELPGAYLDPTREDTSLHPYTEHLLASSFQAPRRLPAVKRRVALPAGGCIYLRRCHRADPEHPSYDRCVAESPSLQTQSSGRRVACHRVQSPASEGS